MTDTTLEGLTDDQTRRLYRDFLTGRPREELQRKYGITEETFWQVVALYKQKKHPNDVGNAKDILGPSDPLVTSRDTGSGATEHPIVAKNPQDLEAHIPLRVHEFNWDATPEERTEEEAARHRAWLAEFDAIKVTKQEKTDEHLSALAKDAESAAQAITETSIASAKAGLAAESLRVSLTAREAIAKQEAMAAGQVAERVHAAFQEEATKVVNEEKDGTMKFPDPVEASVGEVKVAIENNTEPKPQEPTPAKSEGEKK